MIIIFSLLAQRAHVPSVGTTVAPDTVASDKQVFEEKGMVASTNW
jgi:hypothetical protein